MFQNYSFQPTTVSFMMLFIPKYDQTFILAQVGSNIAQTPQVLMSALNMMGLSPSHAQGMNYILL